MMCYKNQKTSPFALKALIYKGSIYIGNISNEYVEDINDVVYVGDTYRAKIIGFNEKHELWDVSLILDPETNS